MLKIILPLDWCAKLYSNAEYSGWEYLVTETDGKSSMPPSLLVSSIEVRNGCKFIAYEQVAKYNGQIQIFSTTEDMPTIEDFGNKNESYSCNCIGE